MTRDEFIEVLKRLAPQFVTVAVETNMISLPRACSIIAENLWVDGIPENKDMEVLRYQMMCLRKGQFDLE